MSQAQLLAFVASVLDSLEIPWMLVGSHAASFYGEPRSTHDVDIVFDLPQNRISELLKRVDRDRYYLSESALREGRMANLIDIQTGDKVDFFFLADRVEARVALARRTRHNVLGVRVPLASPEDTILAKLRWNEQLGGSERQIRDIRGIVKSQVKQLDWSRLDQQIDREGFRPTWKSQIATVLDDEVDEERLS